MGSACSRSKGPSARAQEQLPLNEKAVDGCDRDKDQPGPEDKKASGCGCFHERGRPQEVLWTESAQEKPPGTDQEVDSEQAVYQREPGTRAAAVLGCCALTAVLAVVAGLVVRWSTGAVGGFGMRGAFASAEPQRTRLRITNGCRDEPLWVAYAGEVMHDPQNAKLQPFESRDYSIPPGGLGAGTARWWTKWRCVADGNSCAIGDSGGPGQQCDAAAGCAPPVDTRLTVKFGQTDKVCNTTANHFEGCDFVDVSLQDGFTVPFELEIKGDCKSSSARAVDRIHKVVDCTKLSLEQCPTNESLRGGITGLKVVNPVWSSLAGCFSPCSKLSFPDWSLTKGEHRMLPTGAKDAADMCCPTKEACEGGELDRSEYVKAVRDMCPGLNAYDYDRGMGVGTCPAGTKYEMIFYCPTRKPEMVERPSTSEAGSKKQVAEKTPRTSTQKRGTSQSTRLRITNGCEKEPFWIAYMAKHRFDAENIKLMPLQSHDFHVSNNSSSMRYWPKLRCNSAGSQCQIGDSGGPGQKCDHSLGCAPPLDSRFEGTFGVEGKPCDVKGGKSDGCDFVDVSLVDGFTVPFKIEVFGDCHGKYAKQKNSSHLVVDCSALSVDKCPCREHLRDQKDVNLKVVNPDTDDALGCYSPCSKLTYSNWRNDMALGVGPTDKASAPFCCPAPVEGPESCREGPAAHSAYVQAVHEMCPGVYGYAYDDGMGLLTCPAGTRYEMTFFCPTVSAPSCSTSSPAPAPEAHKDAEPLKCSEGEMVKCPGTDTSCAGDECCDDGSTCPSASATFRKCPREKRRECDGIKTDAK